MRYWGRSAEQSFVPEQSLGSVVVAPMSPDGVLMPGSILANAPVTISSLRDQTGVQASVLLPVSGTWRLFLQTEIRGRIVTAPFTLQVR